jgi:hypothetical protein
VILWVATILPTVIILFLRWYLQRENKRRDALAVTTPTAVLEGGVVEETTDDGVRIAHAVDNNQLDLTDRENLTL